MIIRWQLATYLIFICACKSKLKIDSKGERAVSYKNIHVEIEYAASVKVDLTNGNYTVFYMNKPPTVLKFRLTSAERNEIINKYYTLSLYEFSNVDKIWGTIYLDDQCMIMPKIYTYLTVVRDSIKQKIQLDPACEKFKDGDKKKAKRVKSFLEFVNKIIMSKPELKNPPQSDLMYI